MSVSAVGFRGGRVTCNGQLDAAQVRQTIDAELAARRTLLDAYDRGRLSARGHHRVLRVAQDDRRPRGRPTVARHHVLTALSLRGDDSAEALAA